MDTKNTNLIILPGGSKYTREWARDIEDRLDRHFKNTFVFQYYHWRENNDKNVDIFRESELVDEAAKRLGGGDTALIAYREGIIVALRAIAEKKILPKMCVFIGFPYSWTKHLKFDDEVYRWMSGFSIPTLFIQAEFDPYCEIDFLRSYLSGKVRNGSIVQIYASDSDYDDIFQLEELIKEYSEKIK